MNQLNPNAIGMWIFGGALGYALGDGHGCAIGIAIASGLSFLVSMFSR